MTITGDKTEETPITLSEAIGEVAALANLVGAQHMLLGAALTLLVRCATLPRCAQHALLTAGAAMVDACTIKAGHR